MPHLSHIAHVKRTLGICRGGFTMMELLMIVAVVGVAVGLLGVGIHALDKAKARSIRLVCINSVKECQLAFGVWSGDNNSKFPMAVADAMGGARESTAKGDVFRNFQVLSNELTTPIVTYCPADTRSHATNFAYLNNQNMGFFVGMDADKSLPNAWLCGDRNITNGVASSRGALTLTTGQAVGWTGEMHDGCGNVAPVDGSVQQISNRGLLETMQKSGGWTNRIVLPE